MSDNSGQLARYLPAAEKVAEVELQERLSCKQLSFEHRRRLVAVYFRRAGEVMRLLAQGALPTGAPPNVRGNGPAAGRPSPAVKINLPPRQRQVLARLLVGDSEKQVAAALKLSQHTVHDHIKKLYRTFNAASRGELLSRFVQATAKRTENGE